MPNPNAYLLIFAVGFMGCVLATPLVTRFATWLGAIDRPDQFRRIHKGATPRMGGLGLAFGLAVALAVAASGHHFRLWEEFPRWVVTLVPIGLAALIILAVGVIDDNREMSARVKLLGQMAAVLVLYVGGVRIDSIRVLQVSIPLDSPALDVSLGAYGLHVAIPGLLVTLFWFLACMNIWNLIDGMDGLASGVGLMVSGTMALVAIWLDNPAVAILASALAGCLAGFLLYNWHPACIFLGDSGSLLIGLTIGIIGVQGSVQSGSSISLLFPILAMGLPITDTAMAIFRRWVRNLPLSSADRRHVHHLLIGLGLNPRQAAVFLYCFSSGLCGAVLIGVVSQSEVLALIMGLAGCLAFLLILTSRRDELATLRADLNSRLTRGKQERFAAKVTWEAIQRVELAESVEGIEAIVRAAGDKLGSDHLRLCWLRGGQPLPATGDQATSPVLEPLGGLSGPSVTFRLSSGADLALVVSVHQPVEAPLAADIAFRFLQRLALAAAERLDGLTAPDLRPAPVVVAESKAADRGEVAAPQPATVGVLGRGPWPLALARATLARYLTPGRPRIAIPGRPVGRGLTGDE